MLSALFQNKTGAWRRGAKGEDLSGKGWYGDEAIRDKLRRHTEDTMKEVGVDL